MSMISWHFFDFFQKKVRTEVFSPPSSHSSMGNTNSISQAYLTVGILGVVLSAVSVFIYFFIAWYFNNEPEERTDFSTSFSKLNIFIVGTDPTKTRSFPTWMLSGMAIASMIMFIVDISINTFIPRVDSSMMDIMAGGGCDESLVSAGLCFNAPDTLFLVSIWVFYTLTFTVFVKFKTIAAAIYTTANMISFVFFGLHAVFNNDEGVTFWVVGTACWIFGVGLQIWWTVEGAKGSKDPIDPPENVDLNRHRVPNAKAYGMENPQEQGLLNTPSETQSSQVRQFTKGRWVAAVNYGFWTFESAISWITFFVGASFVIMFIVGPDGQEQINKKSQFGWLFTNIIVLLITGGLIIYGTALKQENELKAKGKRLETNNDNKFFIPVNSSFVSNNTGSNSFVEKFPTTPKFFVRERLW